MDSWLWLFQLIGFWWIQILATILHIGCLAMILLSLFCFLDLLVKKKQTKKIRVCIWKAGTLADKQEHTECSLSSPRQSHSACVENSSKTVRNEGSELIFNSHPFHPFAIWGARYAIQSGWRGGGETQKKFKKEVAMIVIYWLVSSARIIMTIIITIITLFLILSAAEWIISGFMEPVVPSLKVF